jgi:hypothetical protein
MTGWLRTLLAGHFQAGNLSDESQSIQRLIWTPLNTTGIKIESITRWDPSTAEKRAALIIKRNGWKRVKLGIGDRVGVNAKQQEIKGNAWMGSHTTFCIAADGAEAEKLGAEVFNYFNQFSQAIRATLNLLRFEVTEVGELLIVEEARQNYVVPVVVAYAFEEQWLLNPEKPLLISSSIETVEP